MTVTVFGKEQYRPLLHVKDVATATLYCLTNDVRGMFNLAYKNYTIKEIAETITSIIPGSEVIYSDVKFEDLRNYKVETDKILAKGWVPSYDLSSGIIEVHNVIKENRIVNPEDPVYSNAIYLKERL